MIQVYIAIFLVSIVAGGYFWLGGIIDENKTLNTENKALVAENAQLESDKETQSIIDAQSRKLLGYELRDQAAREAEAEKRKQQVELTRLERLSEKKAGLITRFAHTAIEDNVATLKCKSNLREYKDESDCPNSVR